MKKILLGLAALALILMVVAGVLWGPSLYALFFSPMTPLGRVVKVRTIEQFPEEGGFNANRAVEGYRLWMIEFDPAGTEMPPAADGEKKGPIGRVKLIDDRGEKHSMAIYTEGSEGEERRVTQRAMVFSIPQDREPRSLSFDDGSAIGLP